MRKIIIRVVIAAVILLAGIGVFQWHNYQQKVEYRKEALLYFKEEDYSKTISYLGQALKLQSVFAGKLDLDIFNATGYNNHVITYITMASLTMSLSGR